MSQQITKEEWEAANNTFIVIIMWTPKPGAKRQVPMVRASGDYPTRAKAMTAKKRIEKDTGPEHSPERRSVYVARKFDITKLDLFDSYYYTPGEVK